MLAAFQFPSRRWFQFLYGWNQEKLDQKDRRSAIDHRWVNIIASLWPFFDSEGRAITLNLGTWFAFILIRGESYMLLESHNQRFQLWPLTLSTHILSTPSICITTNRFHWSDALLRQTHTPTRLTHTLHNTQLSTLRPVPTLNTSNCSNSIRRYVMQIVYYYSMNEIQRGSFRWGSFHQGRNHFSKENITSKIAVGVFLLLLVIATGEFFLFFSTPSLMHSLQK